MAKHTPNRSAIHAGIPKALKETPQKIHHRTAQGIMQQGKGPGGRASLNIKKGTLGLKGEPAVTMIKKINAGFPYKLLDSFQRATALSMDTIANLVQIPSRTLNRRKQEGRLLPDESERLLRAATVVDKAAALFEGDFMAAMKWLQTPQPALGLQTPLDFAQTEVGAREVEDLIGRLEHGVYS